MSEKGRWVEPTKKLSIKLNTFDRVIGYFSPSSLVRRKKARLYNEFISRKYEAADAGRRTDGWNTSSTSANTEVAGSLSKVRDRSRDLVRNNPYAARGIQVITNNVVGRGIKTQIKADTRAGSSTKEKKLNRIWRAWADTTACDYEGVHNLAGIQRLAMRSVAESGEVFIRLRRERRRVELGPDGIEVEIPPISLQILESDFVSLYKMSGKLTNGNVIVQGIEFDSNGKKVAYHMYKSHPGGDDMAFGTQYKTIRVPADEVVHLYRVDRPGQTRGMPWLHPVALRLRDFDLYEDAQLKRQQVAAMFTAFIHDMEGVDEFDEQKEEVEIGEKMEPGLMEILPPGKDVKLSNPPGADNYKEYTSVVLRAIATGLGLTYFQLTGDLSDVNFSSGRLGFLETQRNFDTWRNNIMLNQFMSGVFNWFKDGIELTGENTSQVRAVHTAPRREMIDPVKEGQALKAEVRNGFKTHSEAVRELGRDPDTHFEEMQKDFERIDELKLILDTDPRHTNLSGGKNEVSTQNSSTPNPKEKKDAKQN